MPSKDPGYRVVVFDSIEEPEPVRELICKETGLHPTDANQWIARMPCISSRAWSEREARNLIDGLYELGVAAEARRSDAIPELTPARTVHKVACLPDGLRVTGLRGEPTHWVPWGRVELIDAGLVEQPDELRMISPPTWITAVRNGLNAVLRRPSLIARRERSLRIAREPVGEIVLVRCEPLRALLLNENALNYAYLGERLKPSASENFPQLLEDLCTLAERAARTPSTEAMRAHGDAREYTFASTSELLKDAQVRLLWRWYRADRERELREQTDFDA